MYSHSLCVCVVYEELTGGQSSIRAEDDELSSLQYEAFTIQRSELADLEHIGEGRSTQRH